MYKLFTLLLILISVTGLSQPITQRTNGTNTVNDPILMASKNLFIPRYQDTTAANLSKGIDTSAALIFTYSTNGYWFRGSSPKKWIKIVDAAVGNYIINDTTIIQNGGFKLGTASKIWSDSIRVTGLETRGLDNYLTNIAANYTVRSKPDVNYVDSLSRKIVHDSIPNLQRVVDAGDAEATLGNKDFVLSSTGAASSYTLGSSNAGITSIFNSGYGLNQWYIQQASQRKGITFTINGLEFRDDPGALGNYYYGDYSAIGLTNPRWIPDIAAVRKTVHDSAGNYIKNNSSLQVSAQFNIDGVGKSSSFINTTGDNFFNSIPNNGVSIFGGTSLINNAWVEVQGSSANIPQFYVTDNVTGKGLGFTIDGASGKTTIDNGTNSLNFILTGNMGITNNNFAPSARLHIFPTINNSSIVVGINSSPTITNTSVSNATIYGIVSSPTIGSGNTSNISSLSSFRSFPTIASGATGTFANSEGVGSVLNNNASGTTLTVHTQYYGAIVANSGIITSLRGVALDNLGLGTNNTGIQLELGSAGSASTPVSGNYSIYDNTGYKSYFKGRVGINTTTPSQALQIHGQIQIDTTTNGTPGVDSVLVKSNGVVKAISATYYGTGVGAGTVTSVTSATTDATIANTTTTPVITIVSAPKLTTARTIQGVSFDGTTNINPISGTGFVKASGTTLSYDNSTYLSSVDTTNITNFYVKVRSLLSGISPITYNSGTGAIGIPVATTSVNGYLSSTDWNTFNNKQSTITQGNLTEATSSILTITGGSNAVIGSGTTIQVKQASGSQNGFLSSTDWTTFNSKEPTVTKGNLTEATSSILTITGGTGAIIGSGLTVQVKQSTTSQSGYLSSTDWNTFNGKQNSLTLGNFTEATSSILTITGGTGSIVGSGLSVQVKVAGTSQSGYLSSTDWNTFNNKQGAITLTTTGTSGAATLISGTLNIPQYSGGSGNYYFRNTGSTGVSESIAINDSIVGIKKMIEGTGGTDFNISSADSLLTFNLPTASASNRGALSTTDWSTFNGKQGAITLTTTGTSGAATFTGGTLNIPQYAGTTYTFQQSIVNNSGTVNLVGDSTTLQGYKAYVSFSGVKTWKPIIKADFTGIANGNSLQYRSSDSTVIALVISGTAPITYTAGTIAITQATTSTNGYLNSTDWNTFNGKQVALSGTGLVSFSGSTPSYNTTSASIFSIISDETGGAGVLVGNASPTFTTQITTPLVVGGTGTTSPLTYKTTSGVGTTGADHIFQVGNNGATEAMRILNSGNVGIGSSAPGSKLVVTTNTSTLQASNASGTTLLHLAAANSTGSSLLMDGYNGQPLITFRTSLGTAASPTGLTSGAGIGGLYTTGYTSAGAYTTPQAAIVFGTTETWSGTAQGSVINLFTTLTGTTTSGLRMTITGAGNVGIGGLTSPSAILQLNPGSTTRAPFKLTSGSVETTPEDGAVEYDGTNFFVTNSTATRYTVAKTLMSSATLDFPSVASLGVQTLTITVAGAATGDPVTLGIPATAKSTGLIFGTPWVSSTNTISIEVYNSTLAAIDPTSATFRVYVTKP